MARRPLGPRWSMACSLGLLLCLLWRVGSAEAAGSRTIILLRSPGDAHVASRLRAELMALGWVVQELSATSEEPARTPAFGEMLKALGALAAVRANPQAAQVELWVAHRASSVLVHDSVGAPADDVLAVLAVEALRAKLLRLGVLGADAAPASIPALPELEREQLFWLSGAPAIVLSPGGLGASVQAQLGLRVEMSQRWSAALWSSFPLTREGVDLSQAPSLPANDVWVDASIGLYGARLSYRPLRSGRWRAGVGLGVTLAAIRMQAHAPAPFHGTRETLFAAGPVLSADLSFEALPGLRLATTLLAGSVFPHPVLEFDRARVADWGRPFGSAALGLELALPGVYR